MSTSTQKKSFTPTDGRHFGLVIGSVLLALALVSTIRHRPIALVATIAGTGALLMLAGLIVPGRLVPLYRAWMGVAAILSRVTTPIVMAIMYFVMITPIALLRRTFGKNPLAARDGPNGFWVVRAEGRSRSMWRQF